MLYGKGFDQLNPYPAPSTFFGVYHSQFHKKLVLPPLRGHNLFLYSKVGFPINSAGEENFGQRQRRSRSRVQINYPGGEDFGEKQSRTGSATGTELTRKQPLTKPPPPSWPSASTNWFSATSSAVSSTPLSRPASPPPYYPQTTPDSLHLSLWEVTTYCLSGRVSWISPGAEEWFQLRGKGIKVQSWMELTRDPLFFFAMAIFPGELLISLYWVISLSILQGRFSRSATLEDCNVSNKRQRARVVRWNSPASVPRSIFF